MKPLYTLLFILIFTVKSAAQVNDLLVPRPIDTTALPTETLYLQVNNLSFIKNNEYFNLIADGYTLLGNKLHPQLLYKPDPHYQLKAGIWLLKYYGRDRFSEAIPTFALEITTGKSRFYIGQLYTEDNHRLSDEIYDFERQLDARSLENGLQHRYNSRHWQTDTWLQWEHFIFKNDTLRERLNFGQTTTFRTQYKTWQIRIPLQIYLQHRGGQINQRGSYNAGLNNALVITNAALGLSLYKNQIFNTKIQLGLQYQYFMYSLNSGNPEELIFTSGHAQKWAVQVRYKHWQTGVSYWLAHKFVAPKGNDMYQSISRRVDKYLDAQNQPVNIFRYHTEPHRQLLRWNTRYQKEIFRHLQLAFAIDVYYQLNRAGVQNPAYTSTVQNQLDYAMGLYLNYRFDFKLAKIK